MLYPASLGSDVLFHAESSGSHMGDWPSLYVHWSQLFCPKLCETAVCYKSCHDQVPMIIIYLFIYLSIYHMLVYRNKNVLIHTECMCK